jgi:hypothetical protein
MRARAKSSVGRFDRTSQPQIYGIDAPAGVLNARMRSGNPVKVSERKIRLGAAKMLESFGPEA